MLNKSSREIEGHSTLCYTTVTLQLEAALISRVIGAWNGARVTEAKTPTSEPQPYALG